MGEVFLVACPGWEVHGSRKEEGPRDVGADMAVASPTFEGPPHPPPLQGSKCGRIVRNKHTTHNAGGLFDPTCYGSA